MWDPQPHTQAKVVDANGRALPCGAPGELLVRGYLVTDGGCWRDPTSTVMSIDSGAGCTQAIWLCWMLTGSPTSSAVRRTSSSAVAVRSPPNTSLGQLSECHPSAATPELAACTATAPGSQCPTPFSPPETITFGQPVGKSSPLPVNPARR